MAEEVYLTPEERLSELGDLLIQSVIKSTSLSLANRQVLFGQVSPRVFRNENYIIFNVLYSFKDKGITPDVDFLQMYLLRNSKLFKDSQGYINLQEFADLDENVYTAYTSAVLKQFNRLLTLDELSAEDFNLTLEKYKVEFSSIEVGKAYSQAKLILYDGLQVGKKFYQGYNDSVVYVKKCVADIEAILDHSQGVGFIDSSIAGIEDDAEIELEKIGDFGLIRELNEQLGGIYTSLFYNIMAPTKGGKSKFTTRLIHNIVVEHGYNASVWAHEGGYAAWWAQLRAIHFEYMYIRGKSDSERVAPLSQKDIQFGNFPSEEIRQLEAASRLDLFTNPNYGVINMIDRPLKLETFMEDIETSVQLNGSRVVLVDYLQLMEWESNLSKPQAIGKGYQAVLNFCKKWNVAAISPSQFTQDFMNEMAKSKEGQAHEVRTAGGESSEIVRTPDINIALYASTEDLIRHCMTIMSVPSRLAEPFPDIPIYADLCSCVFSSIDDDD